MSHTARNNANTSSGLPSLKTLSDSGSNQATKDAGEGDAARSMGAVLAVPMPMPMSLPASCPPPSSEATKGGDAEEENDDFGCCSSPFAARAEASDAGIAPKSASVVGQWNIKEEEVTTLPERHPLERTAVFVPHSEAREVATRAAEALAERCSSAVYDNAKAKATCQSRDGVGFRVRMYRGRGKFNHGVIVEVQRWDGFSPSFHMDALAILDAVEGKKKTTLPNLPLDAPMYATWVMG